MQQSMRTRRSFLSTASKLTASIGLLELGTKAVAGERSYPHSSGNEGVHAAIPADACDCHMHVYDDRFPWANGAKLLHPPATVSMYRQIQAHLRTKRCVVVTPSAYGTDNRCTLDALQQLGSVARGVAVIDSATDDAEIERLHGAGIRGIRFNLALGSVTSVEMIEPLAAHIASRGWNVQVNMSNNDVLTNRDLLSRLPVPVVFDHFGRIPLNAGNGHLLFDLITDLMKRGRAYVKVSGAYLSSKVGPPTFDDVRPLAKALIQAAPTQVVWGSDWPHPTESHKPNDAQLLDCLCEWAGVDELRKTVLVDNPARLYQF